MRNLLCVMCWVALLGGNAMLAAANDGVVVVEVWPDGGAVSIDEGLARAAVLGTEGKPVAIRLHAGTYTRTAPITLGVSVSGTVTAPLSIAPYGDGEVAIRGGFAVTGWREEGAFWVADLPEAWDGTEFAALYVDGERRTPARLPDDGKYFHTAGKVEDEARAKRAFRFAPGDLKPFRQMDGVRVVAFHAWETSVHRIEQLDLASGEVTFRNDACWPFEHWGAKQRYYVENVFEGLDQPGEWYLDTAERRVYYLPLAGEDPNDHDIIAPSAVRLVCFEGELEQGAFVEHVHIEGLGFEYTNFDIGPEGHSDPQAAYSLPAAIELRGARFCHIEDCEVAHTGGYGIWLKEGCTRNLIRRNVVRDLGAGGVRVGGASKPVGGMSGDALVASHNTIDNNHLHAGGRVFRSGVGVFLQHSNYSTVSHNEIADFLYTGISNGWVWGYGENPSHHNIMEYNHIHDIGQGVMSDMGGIYNLGIQPGTVMRHNHIHDIRSFHYGGWGLYTDEGSTEMLLENNVVYNTTNGSFHQHYGRNNRVRNNIFVNAESEQVVVSRVEEHRSFVFERNVVVSKNGKVFPPNWTKADIWADGNVFWDLAGKPLDFGGMDFAAWQATGHDVDSVIADPLFVNAEAHDYRLRADSPAFALGFEPIDLSRCGMYGPKASARLAR